MTDGSEESGEDESFDSYDISKEADAQFLDGDIKYAGDDSGADDDSFFSYTKDETFCLRAMSMRTQATWM